jgi:hypothetical protein
MIFVAATLLVFVVTPVVVPVAIAALGLVFLHADQRRQMGAFRRSSRG